MKNKSIRTEVQEFKDQLINYQSTIRVNKERLDEDPMLAKQLSFWIESTRFLITELEIWSELKSRSRYDETVNKVRNALDRVHQLIVQLIESD